MVTNSISNEPIPLPKRMILADMLVANSNAIDAILTFSRSQSIASARPQGAHRIHSHHSLLSPLDRISCPLLTVQSFTSLIVPTKCWIRQEEDSHVSPGPPFRQRNPVPAVSRLSASRVLSDVPVDPVWQEPFTGSKTSPRTQKRGIRQRMPYPTLHSLALCRRTEFIDVQDKRSTVHDR